MGKISFTAVLTAVIFFCVNPAYGQTGGTKRERKAILRNEFAGRAPLIVHGADTISKENFVNIKADSLKVVTLSSDTARFLYGEYAKDGAIQVWSRDMDDEPKGNYDDDTLRCMLRKVAAIALHFPDHDPLFEINDKRVSKRDFLLLRDDSVFILTRPRHEFFKSDSDVYNYGLFDVRSVTFERELYRTCRMFQAYDFRTNELLNFFGDRDPLFLLDGKEITRLEFLTLGEDR